MDETTENKLIKARWVLAHLIENLLAHPDFNIHRAVKDARKHVYGMRFLRLRELWTQYQTVTSLLEGREPEIWPLRIEKKEIRSNGRNTKVSYTLDERSKLTKAERRKLRARKRRLYR